MAGVAATEPKLSIPGFPGVFTLLKAGAHPTPQTQLKRLVTLHLGERPPIVVCLKAPETHIRVLWSTHFVTLSFTQPTLEYRKVLVFVQDIRLGQLPATVVIHPEWLMPGEIAVPQTTDMEEMLARLVPGHPKLAADTQRLETVSVMRASLSPLFLVHPLMVSPLLSPSTT